MPARPKTHCPQGHPYDATNTYHHPNGSRICRMCRRDGERKRRGGFGVRPHIAIVHRALTHCAQGHPFDEANTIHRANGWRICRLCHRRRARAAYRRTHGLP